MMAILCRHLGQILAPPNLGSARGLITLLLLVAEGKGEGDGGAGLSRNGVLRVVMGEGGVLDEHGSQWGSLLIS